MQKKIFKLLRASLPKTAKQKPFFFGSPGPGSKAHKLKKLNQSSYRVFFKRKEKPVERVILSIFRYFNATFHANLRQYSKSTFWETVFPQAVKLQTVCGRTTNEVRIPKLTRGINGKTREVKIHRDSLKKEQNKENKEAKRRKAKKPEKPIEQYDEIAEQRFYTQPRKQNKSNLKRAQKRAEEENEANLPPPQRCRLCCPLPPPEFVRAPEINEYIPRYQSATVRFSTLFPQPKQTQEKGEVYTMRTNQTLRAATAFSPGVNEFPQNIVKNKKNNDNLKTKSNSHKPPDEVTPKMRALLFEPASLELNYDAVDAPTTIYKDEVLVQVLYSGVCGTDFFITEGKVSCGDGPVILGHEISGKVYAAGSDVDHVKTGDNIAVNAYTACCVCRYCSRGHFSACLNQGLTNSIGISKNGGWAEFVVVKKSQAYKIPDELGLEQAALIQPLSCVLSAMSKLNISHGMDIIVQGLGLSGCLWASTLHWLGHKTVYVSDKSERKRKQFQSLDLNYEFIPPEDIGKHWADIIIECTGFPSVIEKSFNILNPNGQICLFGAANPMAEVRCIPYEIIQKEITIVGNAGNAFRFSEAINVATSMGNRYLDFGKLGVSTFDLEDYRGAFHLKKTGEVNKIVFKLES